MSSLPLEASPTRREKPSCKVPMASAPPLEGIPSPRRRIPSPSNWGSFSITSVLVSAIFFVTGVMIGGMTGGTDCWASAPVAVETAMHCVSEGKVQERIQLALHEYKNRTADKLANCITDRQVQDRIREAVRQHEETQAAAATAATARGETDQPKAPSPDKQEATSASRFPQEAQDVFVGMARVARGEFTTLFNSRGLGVPFRNDTPTNSQAFILYRSTAALPRNQRAANEATKQTIVPLLSVSDATENCDVVNVAIVSTGEERGSRQCLAVVGAQGGAFHLHRFMRMADSRSRLSGSPFNHKAPLKLFGRIHRLSGENTAPPPDDEWSKYYRETLSRYLGSLDETLEKLSPIASAAAVNNTIIVMTCNHGQSDLLVNFVCGARSRKLDLSSVLVFPTDEETLAITRGLGLNAFYDESAFGFVPKEASAEFASTLFGKAVLSKVICAHMITRLGYDILLQDVDVTWYRNPLDYFLDKQRGRDGFDMYIQDDGSPDLSQDPRRSNAGFFFARNNEVTRAFFHEYAMAGDKILQGGNDQTVFNVILNEYSSLYGLRIWTFPDYGDFPSGFVFHRRKEYMKALIAGEVKPYIFHMSWTKNKDAKIQYLQQMGDWFVRDVCLQKPSNEANVNASRMEKDDNSVIRNCCLRDPDIRCHFRDKPSVIPCKESPAAGLIGTSFW